MEICVACEPLCSWTVKTNLSIAALLRAKESSHSQTVDINIVESMTFHYLMLMSTSCKNSVRCKR